MSDRFSSREDVRWNQGAYDDGYKARMVMRAPLSEAPSPEVIGTWCHKSWRAGWADADMTIAEGIAPDPAPMIEGGLLAAAPLGLELAKAVVAQSNDGLDRSEFILKTAIQFLCVWGLGN